jgi:hypothetical protein
MGKRAPAIVSKWTKFVAAGCSHSTFACPRATDALIGFCERYKPEVRIDLGDVHDFTAFRAGAKGTKDESASIADDFNAGVAWLKRYRPTHRTLGNHDHRIFKLIDHPNAIVAHCAGKVIEDLRQVDEANGTIVRPYHMKNGWFTFGDTKFGHGWMYNMQAVRDHAETFGKCVIAHLHVPQEARGRRDDDPISWCVGTLGDPEKFTYAHANRNWLSWAHGFVWGEFNEEHCVVRLERQTCGHGGHENWRLPL